MLMRVSRYLPIALAWNIPSLHHCLSVRFDAFIGSCLHYDSIFVPPKISPATDLGCSDDNKVPLIATSSTSSVKLSISPPRQLSSDEEQGEFVWANRLGHVTFPSDASFIVFSTWGNLATVCPGIRTL